MPKSIPLFYLLFLSLIACGIPTLTAATPLATDRAAARLLDQASWGPTPADIAHVQSVGLSAWIDEQFAARVSDIPDQPLLDANNIINTNLAPVRAAFFQNAVGGSDQLRQRIAFILSQIWVVSQASGVNSAYAFPVYWRVLRDNAFGNYADIIANVTLNPAMGRYLNMANNNKANPARGISANENYAREIMQLFTLGLKNLNADGSVVNSAAAASFTESDVQNMAKVFTGWTFPTAPGAIARPNNPDYYFGQMIAVEANHDTSEKTIFGEKVPAAQTSRQDLDSVVKLLMRQSTLAPFVCRQLIQHLVTSNPSPQYIARISAVFANNGSGVAGDMKAVVKAILLDSEARSWDGPGGYISADFGHLREPVLAVANVLRGLNAALTPANTVATYAYSMGENIFVSPSVFSYFSPSFRTEKGLYGPEFQIHSTQSAPARSNMIYTALYSSLDGVTKVDLTPFNNLADPANYSPLIDYINSVFCFHAASAGLKNSALQAAKAAYYPTNAVRSALFVFLTSAEYQVVH